MHLLPFRKINACITLLFFRIPRKSNVMRTNKCEIDDIKPCGYLCAPNAVDISNKHFVWVAHSRYFKSPAAAFSRTEDNFFSLNTVSAPMRMQCNGARV